MGQVNILEKAHEEVMLRAEKIRDKENRQRFLAHVQVTSKIVVAWEKTEDN